MGRSTIWVRKDNYAFARIENYVKEQAVRRLNYLDIQNVYNAENPEAFLSDYRFREEIPVPGVPFLPVLGVKGSF